MITVHFSVSNMDVKHGHCWRCEVSLDLEHEACERCEVAVYCSKTCSLDDQYRHSSECEVWGPKECNRCHAIGDFKEVPYKQI